MLIPWLHNKIKKKIIIIIMKKMEIPINNNNKKLETVLSIVQQLIIKLQLKLN